MKFRRAAFTLIELLITTSVASVLGGIIYVVASEGVVSFARNAAINRAYTDARITIDRLSTAIDSAGQTPTLVDVTGTALAGATQAQGIRFYRYGTVPCYQIPSGTTASSSLTFNFTQYQAAGQSPTTLVVPGDLVTIPLIGFQGTVTSVGGYTTNGDGSGSVTVNFSPLTSLLSGCLPVTTTQTNFALQHKTTIPGTPPQVVPTVYYSCLVFRQVAYIAVPNASGVGAQLRYYPQAMSTGVGANTTPTTWACGGVASLNTAAAFNNPKNYTVVANLYGGNLVVPTGTPAVNALLPFQLVNGSTLGITICEEGPDYTNRSTAGSNIVSYANTVSLLRSTVGSRCPSNLVR